MKSGSGRTYYLLLVDEFKQYSCTKFGRNESEITENIFLIILSILNEEIKINKVRPDNEVENWELERKCMDHLLGIKFEYTTPNTPQYNGVVKRKYQRLYNKLRETLFESVLYYDLSNLLWSEFESKVTFLDNL